MVNPRATHTNAADSAPGVDDGRTSSAPAPQVNSKPAGRTIVLWMVVAALVVLAFAFLSRSDDTGLVRSEPERSADAAVGPDGR